MRKSKNPQRRLELSCCNIKMGLTKSEVLEPFRGLFPELLLGLVCLMSWSCQKSGPMDTSHQSIDNDAGPAIRDQASPPPIGGSDMPNAAPSVSSVPSKEGSMGVASRPIASVQQLVEVVKVRKKGTLTWKVAVEGNPLTVLSSQDAVQTEAKSQAMIVFKSGSQIQMGPKSLVVVSPPENGGASAQADRAVIRGGELQSTTSRELWLMTSAALFKMKPSAKGEPARANFSIKEGKKLKVKLVAGEALALTVDRRKKNAQTGGAGTAVKEVPLVVNRPLTFEAPQAPEAFGIEESGEAKSWEGAALIKQLSPILSAETTISRQHAVEKNSPQASQGAQVSQKKSAPSAPPAKKTIEPAPSLVLVEPKNRAEVLSETILVKGRLENLGEKTPGKVLVQGQAVQFSSDGSFEARIKLDPGVNLLLIQWISSDSVSHYKRLTVTRK